MTESFKDWLDKLPGADNAPEDRPSEGDLPKQADNRIMQFADAFLLHWFGSVLKDQAYFDDNDRQVLIAILEKMANYHPSRGEERFEQTFMALCAGFLNDNPLSPLQALMMSFTAGVCWAEIRTKSQEA